jgi:hypothetical protein
VNINPPSSLFSILFAVSTPLPTPLLYPIPV